MKNVFISIVIFMIGCTATNKDQDLPGVYTGQFEHEFAKNEDTFIVKKANDGKGVYEISHHTGMHKKLDGKLASKKTIIEDFMVEYNTDSQILTDLKEGRKFIWDRASHSILSGKTKYSKLEEK